MTVNHTLVRCVMFTGKHHRVRIQVSDWTGDYDTPAAGENRGHIQFCVQTIPAWRHKNAAFLGGGGTVRYMGEDFEEAKKAAVKYLRTWKDGAWIDGPPLTFPRIWQKFEKEAAR
jgi:hypothetical protein